MDADPWLTHPHMTTSGRVALLLSAIHGLGWDAVRGRSERRSYANPFTRRIVVRRGLDIDTPSADLAALLAHELTHVRQFGVPRLRRWARGLLYVLWPARRLEMELEAEAHEAATRWRCTGAWVITADSLSGWRWPYLTGASRRFVVTVVRALAERLVEGK